MVRHEERLASGDTAVVAFVSEEAGKAFIRDRRSGGIEERALRESSAGVGAAFLLYALRRCGDYVKPDIIEPVQLAPVYAVHVRETAFGLKDDTLSKLAGTAAVDRAWLDADTELSAEWLSRYRGGAIAGAQLLLEALRITGNLIGDSHDLDLVPLEYELNEAVTQLEL